MATGKSRNSEAMAADREMVLTRVFDAPRELVWKTLTDPNHIKQWWGPKGFTITIHQMDLKPEGIWRHTMHGPDGADYPTECAFIEIVKPERIVYSLTGGKQGHAVITSEVTWTFEAQGDKTKLTLRMLFPSAEMSEFAEKTYGVVAGGQQTLDRLGDHLAKVLGSIVR